MCVCTHTNTQTLTNVHTHTHTHTHTHVFTSYHVRYEASGVQRTRMKTCPHLHCHLRAQSERARARERASERTRRGTVRYIFRQAAAIPHSVPSHGAQGRIHTHTHTQRYTEHLPTAAELKRCWTCEASRPRSLLFSLV